MELLSPVASLCVCLAPRLCERLLALCGYVCCPYIFIIGYLLNAGTHVRQLVVANMKMGKNNIFLSVNPPTTG